jgi:hypothetical protein
MMPLIGRNYTGAKMSRKYRSLKLNWQDREQRTAYHRQWMRNWRSNPTNRENERLTEKLRRYAVSDGVSFSRTRMKKEGGDGKGE